MDFPERSARCPDVDEMKNEELVLNNMALVGHIAKKYWSAGYEYDDLVQEGSIGLMAAAEKFDPEYGFRFSTMAGACIENRIRQYLRAQRKHNRCVVSLEQETAEHGRRLVELIGFQPDEFEAVWKQEIIEQAAAALDSEERELVRRYYIDGVNQSELGRLYGVRQACISRKLKRIRKKMRRAAVE